VSIGGGSSKGGGSGLDTNLQQGQFEFGPTPFDLSTLASVIGQNTQATDARYQQLGLGGSTMQQQDDTNQQLLGQAVQGQEQTQEVKDPALNPALQKAETNLPSSAVLGANQQSGTSLGSLAGTALSLGGIL
jgi:hypothetical protein